MSQSIVSPEVVARYAADAAREVGGVVAVAHGGALHRGRASVTGDELAPSLTLRVELAWGARASEVGLEVQERVAGYLVQMAELRPATVDVVVSAIGAPPAKR